MIFVYHNILSDCPTQRDVSGKTGLPRHRFEQQLRWLLTHRQIVPLSKYLELREHERGLRSNLVALTFDDGLRSTFERVYPLLRRWKVPATLFISTAHLQPGRLLWFSYLNALCFERIYARICLRGISFSFRSDIERKMARRSLGVMARSSRNPKAFIEELAAAYPLPAAIATEYEGMSARQLTLLGGSDFLEGGAHTVNHPYLDQLSNEEQEKEIVVSKEQLAELTGKRVRYFAYPGGGYNKDTLQLLKAAGFEAAFATHEQRIGADNQFEIVRVGVYSVSFIKFWLKAQGVAKLAHRYGLGKP